MAKQSMIQRELKRERLIVKHAKKREAIKEELKKSMLITSLMLFCNCWYQDCGSLI